MITSATHTTSPIARCPFSHGAPPQVQPPPADVVAEPIPRDLGPCHGFLKGVGDPRPLPVVPVEAWENAARFDVVVVGAGMSGLHTAWKLTQGENAPSVAIFERTNHIGGRARSLEVKGAGRPFDLGAMRFIPSQHHRVNALAEHFNIPTADFVVGGDKNLQYFRGERHTNEEIAADPSLRPFKLAPNEVGKSVDELLAMAIEAVIPNFRCLRPDEWEEVRRTTRVEVTDPSTGQTAAVPLSQLGLQNILQRTLSREAVSLITHSVGYHSFLQNWDAGLALEALSADFQPGTVYKTPLKGMAEFPKALAGDFRRNGGKVRTRHTLRTMDWDAANREFRLVFEDREGKAVPVKSKQLVLAMPNVPLQELVTNSPVLQGTKLHQTVGKVTENPMTRLFATFDTAWWNDMGIQAGRSLTDLPLGQVYYYGSEGDTRPYLQVYADGANSEFWEGLQNPQNGGATTGLCATPQLAEELQKQLEEMHGRKAPPPTGFLYKRWADPFMGGAYRTWNVGSDPTASSEAMIHPIQGMPLYVCGEAYSTTQGWIEGALQTSEMVLQQMATDKN